MIAFLVVLMGIVGLVFVTAFLFSFPVMWIVNYLISPAALTAVFGIPHLELFFR